MTDGRRAAAFFDLDRTLIAGSSGLLLTEALVDLGLMSARDALLADYGSRAYRAIGETWLGMQITKRSIARIAGWSLGDLREAARRSAARMEDAVFTEAREVMAKHRDDGLLICIATSTGREIVEPLCERLGADHVIATEYEVDPDDGVLTGGFIGKWLWGPDKAEAVRSFADREGVDLDRSYAYSDSFYDRPMLEMVGHPRAVNPDPLLRGLAIGKGWPVLEFKDMPGGPKVGVEPYDLARPFAHPLLSPVNLDLEGVENIPATGACIVAANHRSYLDPVVLTGVGFRRGRKLRYLGKKEVFDVPLVGNVLKAIGQIRVERGTGSAEPLEEALDALSRGEAIGIFPQGTIPRGRKFFEHRLEAKTGIARLAVRSGAPVVPVALWDTEKVWPRSQRLPRLVGLASRTPVYARVGEPMHLKAPAGSEDDKAVLAQLAQDVMDAISSLLPDEVARPPEPTEAQIREMIPPNVTDPEKYL